MNNLHSIKAIEKWVTDKLNICNQDPRFKDIVNQIISNLAIDKNKPFSGGFNICKN